MAQQREASQQLQLRDKFTKDIWLLTTEREEALLNITEKGSDHRREGLPGEPTSEGNTYKKNRKLRKITW